jgi:acyl carrier protein
MKNDVAKVQEWLIDYIADLTGVEKTAISEQSQFSALGLDSAAVIGMTGDLSDWLGKEIDPTIVYEYPTIEGLAQHTMDAEEILV